MGFSSTTILFILVGLIALTVLALGYYMYKMDMFGGKTVYGINKRLEILEKKFYMQGLKNSLDTDREPTLETFISRDNQDNTETMDNDNYATVAMDNQISNAIPINNPLQFLLQGQNILGGFMAKKNFPIETEEEINREIAELRKQLEKSSENIEVMSDSVSKLSNIEEVSNENRLSDSSNEVSNGSVVVTNLNTNSSIKTNGKVELEEENNIENDEHALLNEYDDLGDTEHIENSELDSYINNAIIPNGSESEEIEKRLDEMSNNSQVDIDVTNNVRIELIANSSKLKDIKDMCKKHKITIGTSTKNELVRKLYKIEPKLYDLLVGNKENASHNKETANAI